MVNFKTTIFLIAVFVFLLQFCGDASASDAFERTYNLKDLEKLVIERDVAIKSARERLNAAKNELYETQASYGPEFSSLYIYSPHGGNLVGRELRRLHWIDLHLGQDVIDLLKIKPARVKEMQAEVEGAEAELKEAERRVLYELRAEYIDILEEKAQAEFYLQLKDIYQNLHELLKKRYLNKETLLSDVLNTERDLIDAKESFLAHRNSFERRRKILAESLGIEASEIEIEDPGLAYSLPQEEKVINSALKNRAEIKRLKVNASKEAARGSTSAYEDINMNLFAGYRLRDDKERPFESGPEVGMYFSIPLAYKSIKDKRSNKFKARENYWEFEAQRIMQDIKKEIRRAYEQYLVENTRFLNAEKGLELKKEEDRLERLRIENTLSDVEADPADLLRIEADTTILNSEKELAKYEKNRSYFEVLYLAGFSQPEELGSRHFAEEGPTIKPYQRALWVWRAKEVVVDQQVGDFFISFCKTKGITRAFLSLDRALLSSLPPEPALVNFITRCHKNGIKVSALFGENLWVYPQKREDLMSRAKSVMVYNNSNSKKASFDGIHLDIEPHTLDEWDTNKIALLEMLTDTYSMVKHAMSSQPELQLGVDIPVFYDKVEGFTFTKLVEAVDVLTVMAYERTKTDSVIRAVSGEVEAANTEHKGILIGFNAKDFVDEAEMETLIANVGDRLSSYPAFAGFCIHDFDHYRILAAR